MQSLVIKFLIRIMFFIYSCYSVFSTAFYLLGLLLTTAALQSRSGTYSCKILCYDWKVLSNSRIDSIRFGRKSLFRFTQLSSSILAKIGTVIKISGSAHLRLVIRYKLYKQWTLNNKQTVRKRKQ